MTSEGPIALGLKIRVRIGLEYFSLRIQWEWFVIAIAQYAERCSTIACLLIINVLLLSCLALALSRRVARAALQYYDVAPQQPGLPFRMRRFVF